MRFAGAYSLHSGDEEWHRRELYEWLTALFEAPAIEIEAGCTGRIRAHLRDELTNAGWSYMVRIDPNFDLTVTGRFGDLAFQVQTGNISRAMYDLLKMEYIYKQKRIECAALALPTKAAAESDRPNVAHTDRVWGEFSFLIAS